VRYLIRLLTRTLESPVIPGAPPADRVSILRLGHHRGQRRAAAGATGPKGGCAVRTTHPAMHLGLGAPGTVSGRKPAVLVRAATSADDGAFRPPSIDQLDALGP